MTSSRSRPCINIGWSALATAGDIDPSRRERVYCRRPWGLLAGCYMRIKIQIMDCVHTGLCRFLPQ